MLAVVSLDVTDAEALELLWALLSAGGHGFHVVETAAPRDHFWIPVTDRARFMRNLERLGWNRDARVRVCPLADEGSFRVDSRPAVVWCRTETGPQAAALRRFRPLPSLVLREGASVRYVALWGLRRPVAPDDAERVSRHLAHKLGTPKKYAALSFMLNPPTTVVRHSRTRPLPIVVAGGTGETVTMRELCKFLPRRIPDPDAWRSFPRPEKPAGRAVPAPEAAQQSLI